MIDMYLRADDEAALIKALPMFRATDENGAEIWRTASHRHALDVIGTIHAPVVVDSKGEIVSGGDPIPGYHANLRLFGEGEKFEADVPEDLIVKPAHPRRAWA